MKPRSEKRQPRKLGVIGGSGFDHFIELGDHREQNLDTPYGTVNSISLGNLAGCACVFIPRHGKDHKLPPHTINYRANIWALQQLGVEACIAVNAVGGIRPDLAPGQLVFPDQIIDYSYGREHTYFVGGDAGVDHIDFTTPYDPEWRKTLITLSQAHALGFIDGGTYACTQGPRLETAAEVQRLQRDGCDMVGMTGMPEAALARELALPYGSLACVVNWAAGVGNETISLDAIYQEMARTIVKVKKYLALVAEHLALQNAQ